MQKKLLVLITSLLFAGCGNTNSQDAELLAGKNDIINYGSTHWQNKLRDIKKGKNQKFRIVQIGDSHTAGDYFSDEIRKQLQRAFGDGGIGLVSPTSVSGQRSAQVKYQNSGWQTLTSRKSQDDFPLGGVLAHSKGQKMVTISPLKPASGKQTVRFMAKANSSNAVLKVKDGHGNIKSLEGKTGHWKHLSQTFQLPISYYADQGSWSIGQIQIENTQPGVVYSSLGINGAQLTHTNRWKSDWISDLKQSEPDLVILEFGTNEATNERLNIAETESEWMSIISQIRKQLPNAGILIVGAPESLKNSNSDDFCGQRLTMLNNVQEMQKRVAKKSKVAYWSWQNAMGGTCSMRVWIAKGLARADGVHFTSQGYEAAASLLAKALIKASK